MKMKNDRMTTLLIATFVLTLGCAVAHGTTWYVSNDGQICSTNSSTCGASEATPCCKIQDGINRAGYGHTVLVSNTGSPYIGPGNRDLTLDLDPEDPSTDIKQITVACKELGDPPLCTIDCMGTDTDRHRGFIFENDTQDASTNVVIEGFEITGGWAPPSPTYGGGMYIDISSPTIRNCLIRANKAKWGGGIAMAKEAWPTIENCTIRDNNVDYNGGGIFVVQEAGDDDYHVTIKDCLIVNNTAGNNGGGIYLDGTVHTHIKRCEIADNSAGINGAGIGAGGDWAYANIKVASCYIHGNGRMGDTDNGGGVALMSLGSPLFANMVISDNEAANRGGGIFVGGDVTFKLYDSTVCDNSAGVKGGGIAVDTGPQEAFHLFNSIVWGNDATIEPLTSQIFTNANASIDYNDIEGWTGGTGNLDDDPGFVSGEYRLSGTSPVIDKGSNTNPVHLPDDFADLDDDLDYTEDLPLDLDGFTRIIDGDGNSSSDVDMGAYEYDACTVNADCDDADPCNGAEVCLDGNCRSNLTDCNLNGIEDLCDLSDCGCSGGNQSADCNGTWTPDECEGGPFDAQLVESASNPPDQGSLWRSKNHVVRLTFACDISTPGANQIEIKKMEPNGVLADPDLSGDFEFTVEGDRVLRIKDTSADGALAHGTWYAIRNQSWANVACFEVQYLLQIGDADANKYVTNDDLSAINAHLGPTGGADDSRYDIDGSMFVTNGDLGICDDHNPSLPVDKPTGHDAPCP